MVKSICTRARKRAEEALLRLSSAVRTSIDSIVLTDLEGTIVEINDATLAMYGGTDPADLIGHSVFELIAPDDRARAVAGMMKVLEKGYLKEREYQILRKDGRTIRVCGHQSRPHGPQAGGVRTSASQRSS